MKVVCDGLDLSIATAQVIKAISNKTTNPVLEGIKLNAENDTLKLSATDLELAIEKTIKADVKSEGEAVIPGKFFSEFIKKLTDEKIELELNDKNRLKINYTDSESFIQCYNALEFPNLNTVDDGEYFTIKQKDFKTLINKSIFSTALDDTRPVLKGCCFEIEENNINSIGLDGYRLAFVKKPLVKTTIKTTIIVPAKSLTEICKFLEDNDEEINVYIQKNFLMVEFDNTKIITRLIDGDFINYKQIIPKDFTTSITLSKTVFEEAIERTSVLSRVDRNNLVKFEIKEKLLTLTSNSDIGNIKENIGVSLKGNDLTIAFNSRYFSECLRTVSDEAIKINFNMPSSPCIVTPSDGDEYLYLILPVRIINQ
ncbi:MAG: DNA polymerase III subunit beta [Clostridia bacterium]|nr:DNA polymerase III subunit beta [Clostridia bacterium]